MNRSECALILGEAYGFFPQYKLETNNVDSWFRMFSKTEAKVFRTAMLTAIKNSGKFPTPGDVKNALLVGKMTAQEAWDYAVAASENFRILDQHLKDFPLVLRAAKLTGMQRISFTDYAQLDFVRRDFIQIYNDLIKKESIEDDLMEIDSESAKKIIGGIFGAIGNDRKNNEATALPGVSVVNGLGESPTVVRKPKILD